MPGRPITIFLIDGTASGPRTAELGLSTIKALVIPRASLSGVAKRPELQKTGVYVLAGDDPDKPGIKKVYIGEADAILPRLSNHNSDESKDFWNDAVIFVSKDENLTKAHARFLEARLIGLVKDARRATIANSTGPSSNGFLPEAESANMEEFISQARLLLRTLGYDILEPLLTPPTSSIAVSSSALDLATFKYEGEHFSATCVVDLDAGQFVVKSGSLARKNEAPSLSKIIA